MVFGETRCGRCGISFRYPVEYGVVLYCSASCRVSAQPPKHPWEYKGCYSDRYYRKRRRRKMARGDKIDALVVYVAYDWTCMLCGGRIDPSLQAPHPKSATIEHKVSLANGGRHTWDNVVPSHKDCNEEKDNT